MRKKTVISGILAAAVTVAATFGGCSLVSSNSKKDMEQVIATVDISKSDNFKKDFGEDALAAFKSVGASSVIKRDLVSYFLNVGYSYVNDETSYSEVFNSLLDALANTEILTQYSTMYLLTEKAKEDADAFKKFENFETEIEKYEYLLDEKEINLAEYSLRSSINSAIDANEKRILDDESSSSGAETRETPKGVGAEQDEYYPKTAEGALDYNIYTGYENYLLSQSGAYKDKSLEGTTRATRIRAYNNYVSSLTDYSLLDASEEKIRDVRSLSYVNEEYLNRLKSQVINKYVDEYEAEQEEKLKSNNYSHIQSLYEYLLGIQKESFKSEDAFITALGNVSDSSFIVYAPKTDDEVGTYGYVYNILLPYSSSQELDLSKYKVDYADEDVDSGFNNDYYFARNKLLHNIKTYDRREPWFTGETDYAFDANEAKIDYYGTSGWLFFEDNLRYTDRYKSIENYYGKYSYNGTVIKKDDGKYQTGAKKYLDIDEMLREFSGYINYVLGIEAETENNVKFGNYGKDGNTSWTTNSAYYGETDFYTGDKNDDDQDQIDYSKFVYATGKVSFGKDDTDTKILRANVLNKKDSMQYKVLSAVNELQYAYTTDTGVLSQYIGYSVNAGDTSYIKEFEYAAHEAVNNGAGSFAVCAGDYGWHLIYVTYAFDTKTFASVDGGQAYDGTQFSPDWENNIDKEGTFENLFYELMKTKNISDVSTTRRTKIITNFSSDSTVTKYEKRYKDLLNLDSNS